MQVGQKFTLLRIDDMMAMTHRYEFEVREARPEPFEQVGYHKRPRLAVMRLRGKRKDAYLDLKPDDIVLDGWNVPFLADTECAGVYSGNACYNLVGNPGVIRICLENRALLPISDGAKAKILVSPSPRTTCDESGVVLLYPEIETHHAIINRMKGAE
jgi:hypothetical protein